VPLLGQIKFFFFQKIPFIVLAILNCMMQKAVEVKSALKLSRQVRTLQHKKLQNSRQNCNRID